MTRIITFIALLIVGALSAQSKLSNFEQAVILFNQSENAQAKVLFENEVKTETENWLPYYYLSLLNATQALENKNDLVKMKALLETAQKNQDKINKMQPENAEVLLTQALINTGWIVYNPFEFGQRYSVDIEFIFQRALKLEPNNPRVILQNVQYEIGKARYFGQDVKVFCPEISKAIELFATFKPISSLHPNWGLEQANELLDNCK